MEQLGIKKMQGSIVDMLKDEILSGHIACGTEMTQNELAASLGVSRMPVREALIILEYQGLIERLPNNHVRVADFSGDYFQKIFRLCAGLELNVLEEMLLTVRETAGEQKAAEEQRTGEQRAEEQKAAEAQRMAREQRAAEEQRTAREQRAAGEQSTAREQSTAEEQKTAERPNLPKIDLHSGEVQFHRDIYRASSHSYIGKTLQTITEIYIGFALNCQDYDQKAGQERLRQVMDCLQNRDQGNAGDGRAEALSLLNRYFDALAEAIMRERKR